VKGNSASRRRRLTYANVTSTLALVIAISGGTAFAATKLITGRQIAKGTITATNIKSGSLLSKDFKKGQIPRGAIGATGATGATGAAGSALGYGFVTINGSGNPELVDNAGITTVSTPQANIYCIVPPAGVTPSSFPLQISPAGGGNSVTVVEVSAQQCPGDYEVQASGAFLSGQGFSVAIP
jgi:hypothetical protein